jgi:hypothetical protein
MNQDLSGTLRTATVTGSIVVDTLNIPIVQNQTAFWNTTNSRTTYTGQSNSLGSNAGAATAASTGYWTGYWTWVWNVPPPGGYWYWTWVWVSGTGASVSS